VIQQKTNNPKQLFQIGERNQFNEHQLFYDQWMALLVQQKRMDQGSKNDQTKNIGVKKPCLQVKLPK
jgi:hypothetical protein